MSWRPPLALAALGFRADLPADGDWESYGPDTLVVVLGAATDGGARSAGVASEHCTVVSRARQGAGMSPSSGCR